MGSKSENEQGQHQSGFQHISNIFVFILFIPVH